MMALSHFYKSQNNQASIDLGSNALRVLIVEPSHLGVKIIKNLRYPIRLGKDVFKNQKISKIQSQKLKEIFVELLFLFSEFNVTQVNAVATSAMRDAKNGEKIISEIFKLTGIDLKIISGKKEAEMISYAVCEFFPLNNKNSIIMDIGGGSTELILLRGKKIIAAKSFNIGTVRLLERNTSSSIESQFSSMTKFLQKFNHQGKIHYFIGTGGNLRRLGKAKGILLNKKNSLSITKKEIDFIKDKFQQCDSLEKFEKLKFDLNQMDVFLPALFITSKIQLLISKNILYLPPVGLKEGLILKSIQDKKIRKNFIKESLKSLG